MGQVVGKLSHPPPSQPFTFPTAQRSNHVYVPVWFFYLSPTPLPTFADRYRIPLFYGVLLTISAIAQKIAITPTSANLFVYTSDSGLLKKNKMLLHLALLSLQFNMCFSRKEFLRFAVKRRRENAVENGGKACLSGCFNQDQFHSGFPCFVPTHVSLLIQFIINYVYVIHS